MPSSIAISRRESTLGSGLPELVGTSRPAWARAEAAAPERARTRIGSGASRMSGFLLQGSQGETGQPLVGADEQGSRACQQSRYAWRREGNRERPEALPVSAQPVEAPALGA